MSAGRALGSGAVSGSAMISAACSGVSSYPDGSPVVSPSAASSYEESAQETSAQETSAHETSAHETSAHETSAQETTFQAASAQETESHETESQETFALATSSQLTASKDVSPVSVFFFTHWSSARFGFGGRRNVDARLICSSPTPTEPRAAPSTSFVDAIRAPLTWSGVNSGCFA